MTINMTKGQNISLEKESAAKKFSVGLGWDAGDNFDLDASIIRVDENGKAPNNMDVVYFNNLKSTDGAVIHTGDNLTGQGDGDDETINIDFNKVAPGIKTMNIIVDIFKAEQKNQNFGQVKNAFVRIYETETKKEIAKYDLSEDYSSDISIKVAAFYLHNTEWKFKALGEGSKNNLINYMSEAGIS